jgi:hypothetical protein
MDNLRVLSTPFVYTPLQAPHSIRVLDKQANGSYFLSQITVDPELKSRQRHYYSYHALSYTWGTQVERVSIKLGDVSHHGFHSFNITPSLSNALDDFFTDNTGITSLWVDAICINQNDLQERDQQVRRMKTIYEHAEKVYIYLGDTPTRVPFTDTVALDGHREDCANAVKLIKYLRGLLQLLKIDWGVSLASQNVFHGISTDPVITSPMIWYLLRDLFQDAWFERLCKLKTIYCLRDGQFADAHFAHGRR